MSAHTLGPWVVRHDERDGFCVHAPTIESQAGCLYRIVLNVNGDETPNPTYGTPEANARLIAAAPELLAELKEVLQWAITEKAPLRRQEIESIRRCIAKATGEQA